MRHEIMIKEPAPKNDLAGGLDNVGPANLLLCSECNSVLFRESELLEDISKTRFRIERATDKYLDWKAS